MIVAFLAYNFENMGDELKISRETGRPVGLIVDTILKYVMLRDDHQPSDRLAFPPLYSPIVCVLSCVFLNRGARGLAGFGLHGNTQHLPEVHRFCCVYYIKIRKKQNECLHDLTHHPHLRHRRHHYHRMMTRNKMMRMTMLVYATPTIQCSMTTNTTATY